MHNNNRDLPFDIDGNMIPKLGRRHTELAKRSPPEDPDNYRDYIFWLSWLPREGECLIEWEIICTKAFEKLRQSKPCGQNHGSAGDRMTVDAKIDVGCGEFKWNVEAPKDPEPEPEPELPALGDQICHGEHKQTPTPEEIQDEAASNSCKAYADGATMKAGDADIVSRALHHMNYRISWKQDCDEFEEQSIDEPVEGESCYSLMRANYKSCNNGGAGGYRDVGCLRYEFYVDQE
ncbi:hypothetical protein FSARC_14732 [Fusarium sarcochroum]|uniref:Uncharacterized protein n=1 Tax=Fusarium sarcochroum TaxID=1208366 RepID=A0A8H4SRJ8_9HYPO|nr:hypothetical protein FSARC_14732 [Fusarium sarcochroum]